MEQQRYSRIRVQDTGRRVHHVGNTEILLHCTTGEPAILARAQRRGVRDADEIGYLSDRMYQGCVVQASGILIVLLEQPCALVLRWPAVCGKLVEKLPQGVTCAINRHLLTTVSF